MMNGTTGLFIQVVGLFLNEKLAPLSDLSEDLGPESCQFLEYILYSRPKSSGTQVGSVVNPHLWSLCPLHDAGSLLPPSSSAGSLDGVLSVFFLSYSAILVFCVSWVSVTALRVPRWLLRSWKALPHLLISTHPGPRASWPSIVPPERGSRLRRRLVWPVNRKNFRRNWNLLVHYFWISSCPQLSVLTYFSLFKI